ncbi:hypothetical protein, partial [Salmonella enterica]|uniref:hypothetical protein n=1 Tax=Salmonella enterica TaxID=28901 RepID=UPI003298FD86
PSEDLEGGLEGLKQRAAGDEAEEVSKLVDAAVQHYNRARAEAERAASLRSLAEIDSQLAEEHLYSIKEMRARIGAESQEVTEIRA